MLKQKKSIAEKFPNMWNKILEEEKREPYEYGYILNGEIKKFSDLPIMFTYRTARQRCKAIANEQKKPIVLLSFNNNYEIYNCRTIRPDLV